MRLQAYMIEEGRTKTIDEDTAISLMKKKCNLHIRKLRAQTRPHIYRGIRQYFDYGVIDPKTASERRSANTSNYMTLLMDNLPSWKGYPKRSQSIICTTKQQTAQSYGQPFYVYPTDACKFGVVPSNDVWSSFDRIASIPYFNKALQMIDIEDKTYSGMKAGFIKALELEPIRKYNSIKSGGTEPKDIISALSRDMMGPYGDKEPILSDFVKKHLTLYSKSGKGLDIMKHLDKELNPGKNSFKNKPPTMTDDWNEIWIGNAPIFLVKATESISAVLEKENLL